MPMAFIIFGVLFVDACPEFAPVERYKVSRASKEEDGAVDQARLVQTDRYGTLLICWDRSQQWGR